MTYFRKLIGYETYLYFDLTRDFLFIILFFLYIFSAMCDFQYLPIKVEGENSQPKCMLDEILPSGLDGFNFMA